MSKGIFGNVFGKKEKSGGCCDMQIVEDHEEDSLGSLACDCNEARDDSKVVDKDTQQRVVVRVLGPGCRKCHELHDNVMEVSKRTDGRIEVEYVTDMSEIAAYGIMSTPALLVGEKVVSAGKVLSPSEIASILEL